MKRNISTDYIFYYIPKTNNNNTTTSNYPITSNETLPIKPIKKREFKGLKGSSTFDYLNNMNQINPKLPDIFTNSFLTSNLRSKKSAEDIERQNMLKTISINPANKLRLSNNCELFHILNKTLMNDKNSLKEVNNRELLGINLPNEKNLENNDFVENISKKTNFKNFYIKKSLSSDEKHFKNRNSIFQQNDGDNANNNVNNKVKGINVNFLYNQIFPKFFFEKHDKYNIVDNKLNIYYAENDAQFRDNLMKKNKRLRLKGKKEKKLIINSGYVADKLLEIRKKIGFVKGVSDYSIPSIILQKVKQNNKRLRLNKGKPKEFLLPFEEIKLQVNRIDKLKTKILAETMSINNINNQK